jgi:excisionase family DNA binding protein
MPLLVVALEDVDAGHLARAIQNYEKACRQNGARLPIPLREIHDTLLSVTGSARSGQERTRSSSGPPLSDDAPVSLLLDFESAGRWLDVSERTVRRLVEDGEIRSVSIGRLRRIHRDEVIEYADRLRTPANESDPAA